jgi:hypothetical protein
MAIARALLHFRLRVWPKASLAGAVEGREVVEFKRNRKRSEKVNGYGT